VATAALIFSVSSLCVKLTGDRLPVLEIVCTRGLISGVVTALLACYNGTASSLFGSRANRHVLVLRGACGAATMIAYYLCIQVRAPLHCFGTFPLHIFTAHPHCTPAAHSYCKYIPTAQHLSTVHKRGPHPASRSP
jgi:hypothetical protein